MVTCVPHPGLGSVIVRRQQIDLATCKTSPAPPTAPSSGPHESDIRTIVFHGRVVVRARKGDAIAFDGTSPDGRWTLYAIDRFASASLAADGLPLRAIRSTGGRSFPIATGLVYASYRSWCGNRLVMTAGFDRTTTTNKWLITSSPPGWGSHVLAKSPRRAFGSLTCASGDVVVQSTTASPDGYRSPHWSLWHVAWDGRLRRLTSPPANASDESPQYSGGVLYFVRGGWLYALHVGRLLKLPATTGYFGHTDWPYTVTR